RGPPGGRNFGGRSVAVTGPPASVTESSPLRQAGRGIGRAAALIGGITVVARVVGFGRQLVFAHTVGSHCLGTAYATANQGPNISYDVAGGGARTGAIVRVLAGAAARRSAYRPVAKSQAAAVRSGGVRAGPGPAGNGAGPGDGAGPGGNGAGPGDGGPGDSGPGGGAGPGDGGGPGDATRPRAAAEAAQIASALLTWAVVLLVPASLVIALAARPLATVLLAGVPHCSQAAAVDVSSHMLAIFAPQILLYGLAVVLYGILQAH